MFMKLGKMKGESRDAKHPKEIDVLAWSWGASNSSGGHVGGGMGAGKVNVQDLSFTKYIDTASPELFLACCEGTHELKAVLTVRKSSGKKPLEYLIITMEKVFTTSYSTGGSGGEDKLTENVTLAFDKVKIEYTEQTDTGDAGDKPKSGWDIAANKPG
jgi:type VI secretion system secreted protein Hcp